MQHINIFFYVEVRRGFALHDDFRGEKPEGVLVDDRVSLLSENPEIKNLACRHTRLQPQEERNAMNITLSIGDRVKMTRAGYSQRLNGGLNRGKGTVRKVKDWPMITILRDGENTTSRWHEKFWEPITP